MVLTINTAVRNMQAYTDGVEEDLRAAMGLASHDDDPDLPTSIAGGDAETGPAGHRAASTTWEKNNGSQTYVPPPA
jgi:hypothetical protein